jgi:hypothetical protein
MMESEVRKIALNYIREKELASCSIASVRRFPRAEIPNPETVGDEWVIQLRFNDDGTDASIGYGLIVIDDATGEAFS